VSSGFARSLVVHRSDDSISSVESRFRDRTTEPAAHARDEKCL